MNPDKKAASRTIESRFVGAFFGGCCAFFSLGVIFPILTNIWELSLVIFIFYSFFAWIAAGTSRFAPMSLQMGVCYLLTTVPANELTSSLMPAINRCAGVFIGIIIATVISYVLPCDKEKNMN